MVRVISQETFDDIVRENMEEFEMSREEAVKEARDQFQQQGVNLSNIVMWTGEIPPVLDALTQLSANSASEEDKLDGLRTVTSCCQADLAQRVMATKNGAYSFLLRLAGPAEESRAVRREAISCLAAVMDSNPDYLETQGISLLLDLLEDPDLYLPALDWLLVCCVRHEENRVAVVGRGILPRLEQIARGGGGGNGDGGDVRRDNLLKVCRVWMALVQDDDIRVPFGKAHDHSREIVENHSALQLLTKALATYKGDSELMHLCLATLASLCVRNEYCQAVVDEGGLQFLHSILLNCRTETELVTRSLILLKVLAGNDKVKSDVGRSGGIPLVMAAISENMQKAAAVEAGFQAIASICLRNSENAKEVMETDGAYLTVTAMSRHPNQRKVQAACAAAIRNIVSRERVHCQPFIDLGIEELLNAALQQFRDEVGDTLKAALRDLGLKVELVERWTGTGPAGLQQ